MYAILPPEYPLGEMETFPIELFEGKEFLMPYGRFDLDVKAALDKNGVKPRIRPCHVDDETVIRMVGKGLGLSMMAEMMLRGRTAGVQVVPISPATGRELGMGMHMKESVPDGILHLRECVLAFIGTL
jgi:DNA-binding transcriptional LysR family regulator